MFYLKLSDYNTAFCYECYHVEYNILYIGGTIYMILLFQHLNALKLKKND